MLEGYEAEYEDCMVCDYTGGPVLIRVEDILTNPSSMLNSHLYLFFDKKMLTEIFNYSFTVLKW